jgi:hypothetical protein
MTWGNFVFRNKQNDPKGRIETILEDIYVTIATEFTSSPTRTLYIL